MDLWFVHLHFNGLKCYYQIILRPKDEVFSEILYHIHEVRERKKELKLKEHSESLWRINEKTDEKEFWNALAIEVNQLWSEMLLT